MTQYPAKIPNGATFDCATCHVNAAGSGPRNDFGQDVAAHKSGSGFSANIRWSELWFLDSDGDGQTNGQELGDPCGDWMTGATPERTTDISNPGDATSTSPNPGTACAPPGGEDAGQGGDDAGGGGGGGDAGTGDEDAGPGGGDDEPGCFGNSVVRTEAPLSALGLLGLAFVLRRRRR